MTGKNTLLDSTPFKVVISEWPPVAIDTNHLLPQHFFYHLRLSTNHRISLTFLWDEIQVLRAVLGRIARQLLEAQPCSSSLRKRLSGR
jgi:hypothetical protein